MLAAVCLLPLSVKSCGNNLSLSSRRLLHHAKADVVSRAISDEAVLNGILFVLHTGIVWKDLPQALGYGSGMTC